MTLEPPQDRLILASASPRRADLLRAAGFTFDVEHADVDERRDAHETPTTYVRRLALVKASVVAHRFPRRPVLGADTAVVINDLVLGKPEDAADAGRMLRLLSGRPHEVMTGVALVAPDGAVTVRDVTVSVVLLAVTPAEIAWYVASGEPFDKAGAYGIQGLASRFVERIEGSYTAVVGLPVALVHQMLREAGVWTILTGGQLGPSC